MPAEKTCNDIVLMGFSTTVLTVATGSLFSDFDLQFLLNYILCKIYVLQRDPALKIEHTRLGLNTSYIVVTVFDLINADQFANKGTKTYQSRLVAHFKYTFIAVARHFC